MIREAVDGFKKQVAGPSSAGIHEAAGTDWHTRVLAVFGALGWGSRGDFRLLSFMDVEPMKPFRRHWWSMAVYRDFRAIPTPVDSVCPSSNDRKLSEDAFSRWGAVTQIIAVAETIGRLFGRFIVGFQGLSNRHARAHGFLRSQ